MPDWILDYLGLGQRGLEFMRLPMILEWSHGTSSLGLSMSCWHWVESTAPHGSKGFFLAGPSTDKVEQFWGDFILVLNILFELCAKWWAKTSKLLYFGSSPPWHLSSCYWQIFWHSIWHIFWHSIWHSIWHIYLAFYLAYLLAYVLAYLLAFYLAYLLAYLSISYLAFYLSNLLALYLAVEVQRCSLSSEGPRLRSSSAHWARRVPGWGPAVLTELGSQVEVQRCPVRSDPCSWGPAVAWRRVGKAEVDMEVAEVDLEVDAEVVEENKRRRRRRRRRRTTLIKSNNPHLAGGE